MVNAFLIVVEVTALAICLCYGILWMRDPSAPYEPTVYVSGLTFFATAIFRRVIPFLHTKTKKEHRLLHIETKNTLFCPFFSEGNTRSGYMSLVFYQIAISNVSDSPFTIKDVKISYSFNNREIITDSFALTTGIVRGDDDDDEDTEAIIVHQGKGAVTARMFFMNWHNLISIINKNGFLHPGGVIRGSALFQLEFKGALDIWKVKGLALLITDYSDNTSTHPIKIEKEWIKDARNREIHSKRFEATGDGDVKYI